MRARFLTVTMALGIGVIAALASCKEAGPLGSTATCYSQIDSAASPAVGALTFYGHFSANESLLLQTTQNSKSVTVATGTPATDRTSLTLTGLPSGTTNFFVVFSCQGGQDNRGFHSYFVK
jgi:hypothetical protein